MRLLLVSLLLLAAVPAHAGWRAECRALARTCRHQHGTTTTTLPFEPCGSENCHGMCLIIDGQYYVAMVDALSGECSLPCPPSSAAAAFQSR